MKGKDFKRVLAFVLALSVILGTCSVNVTVAEAKSKSSLSVELTGKRLLEGFALTKGMIRKTVKVTKNGKTLKYSIPKKQLNTTIKPSKNGKKKLRLKVNGQVRVVSAEVNYMTNLYVRKIKNFVLTEDDKFSEKIFRKNIILMAEYQYGKDKKFTNYQVKAPNTNKVKADKNGYFTVTAFVYAKNGTNGMFKCKVRIRVVKKKQNTIATVPTATTMDKPTVAPSKEPTSAPTPTATPSEKPSSAPTPTAAPSEKPSSAPTPTAAPSEEPSSAPTSTAAPSEKPSSAPTPTATPSVEPSSAPTPTVTPSETPDIFANLTVVRNGEGNVMVNNNFVTFSDDTATEKVTKGNCTFNAINTNEYRFVRLVDAETGDILSTEPSCSIEVNTDRKVVAVFERVYTITINRVGGKGKVRLNGEFLEFYNDVATYKTVAGNYDGEAIPTDGCNFVSVTSNESDKPFSVKPTFTVSVASSNVELTVNFADAEKTVNVIYQHDNGQVLVSQAVPFGESAEVPKRDIFRPDKTLRGWQIDNTIYYGTSIDNEFYDTDGNSLSDKIKALTAQKQDVTIVSYYEDSPMRYGILKLPKSEHTSISYDGDVTKNEDGSYTIAQTSLISLSPIVPEGKFFAGWKYTESADNEIISFDEEYIFVMPSSNISIEPVFSDTPVEKKPVVHFVGEYELFPENSAIKFSIAAELPEGFSKTKWHMLYTAIQLDEEEMILGSSQVASKEILSPGSTTTHWTYSLEMPPSVWQTGNTVVYFRLCLEYVSDMGSDKTYSKIIPITFPSKN